MTYLDHIKKATYIQGDIARVGGVIGDAGGSSLSKLFGDAKAMAPADVKDGVGTAAGAVAGLLYGHKHKHPWLGIAGGASLGRNLPALFNPSTRRTALVNMGETGVAIAFSKAVPRHPFVAFVVGDIAARLVTYFTKLRG